MITCLDNHKKIFLIIILFFIISISIYAEILIVHDEATYPGGLIRVIAVANEKIDKLYVLLKRENGEQVSRFEGFTYNPGPITGFSNIGCMVAILSTGSTLKYGKYKAYVYINNEKYFQKELPVIIEKKEFVKEIISLNENLTNLRKDTSKRREKESENLNSILAKFNKENVFIEAALMIKPVIAEPCYITSGYGDIRKFVYKNGETSESIHNGIDYAAEKGSFVLASADGKVVFAGNRLITGNSIVIEHLPGLYSIYYHMDKLSVTENMVVSKGAIIGFLGSTGLATGPHLHWEIRNQRTTVDPDFLLTNLIIDKDKIISIIKNDFTDMAGGR